MSKISKKNINKKTSKEKTNDYQNNEQENIAPEVLEEAQNHLIKELENIQKANEEKILNLQKENLANLQNHKKQQEKEIESLKKYMFQKFFEDILIVLDSLETGLKVKPDNFDKFIDGLKMTNTIFINILKKYNVEVISVKVGDVFDDSLHECLGTDPVIASNVISSILSTGYKIQDRVIRPTKVIVGIKV